MPELTEATAIVPAEPARGLEVQHAGPMIPKSIGGLGYLADFARLADAISQTEMVPAALRGRPDAVLAVFMAGYEIGVGPMQALQSINMIQGRPSLSAELMRALIVQAGHQFHPEATDVSATIRYRRREWASDQWSTVTYTIEDARRAGLVEWYERWTSTGSGKSYKQTWNPFGPDPKPDWVDSKGEHKRGDNYYSRPRAMLSARATSEAARLDFADVIAGLSYTPDEVEEFAPIPTGLSRAGQVAVVDLEVAGVELVSDAPTPVVRHDPTAGPVTSTDPNAAEQRKRLRKLRALLKNVEITEETDVLLVVSGYIGRDITALDELTGDEAESAIARAVAP